MAAAGWICTSSDPHSPSAMCFFCLKELDGWERTDDPKEEHSKHSPECRFILLNKPEDEWLFKDLLYLIEGRLIKLVRIESEKKPEEMKKAQATVRQKIVEYFKLDVNK